MRKVLFILTILTAVTVSVFAQKPWSNGRLKVSANQRFLQFENGNGSWCTDCCCRCCID